MSTIFVSFQSFYIKCLLKLTMTASKSCHFIKTTPPYLSVVLYASCANIGGLLFILP